MTARLDCPLCPATNLPEGAEKCPTCGADVGPLQRIRRLRRSLPASSARASAPTEQLALPSQRAGPSTTDGASTFRRPSRRIGWWVAATAAAVMLSSALTLAGGMWFGESRGDEHLSVAPPLPEVIPAGAPSHVEPVPAALPPAQPEIPKSLRASLSSLPGFTVIEQGNSTVVIPSEGIFGPGGVTPRHPTLASLAALRTTLDDAPSVDVRVEGATDDRPVGPGGALPDNMALATLRAVKVSALIGGASGPRWSIGVADRAPFPNDSPENRARNRSVRIVLTPSMR